MHLVSPGIQFSGPIHSDEHLTINNHPDNPGNQAIYPGNPGIYRVRMKRPSAPKDEWTEREMLYAVNLDPEEGNLKRVTSRELGETFSDVEFDTFDAMEKVDQISRDKSLAGGTELWRQFLWAVLILLALETVLAHLFGRKHR